MGAALAVALPAMLRANDNSFTAADVLGWEKANQDAFFETSISMAGVLASQSELPAARCINDWYYGPSASKASINDEIRSAMRQYSGYYPGIVIVAVIERACGTLSLKPQD